MKTVSYHHTPAQEPLVAKTLVQCLRENAEKQPEKTAIVFRDEHGGRKAVTFAEWCESMEKLGTAFIKLGMQCGSRIGAFLPNCYAFPMIQFGLNQAGVVMVPMAPTTKLAAEDFSFLVERFNLNGICLYVDKSETSRSLLSLALRYVKGRESMLQTKMRFPIITVSDETFAGTTDFKSLLSSGNMDHDILRQREAEFNFESTALICLTSGSTGFPKGVEFSHMYLLFVCTTYFGDRNGIYYVDRPIVHLGGNWTICAAASAGNTAVICHPMADVGNHDRTESLVHILQKEKVTSGFLPPYSLYDLLEYNKECQLSLDYLENPLTSGSTITWEELKQGMELIPGLRFGYGSVEVSGTDHAKEASIEEKIGNVGYPIPNTEIKVADENGRALPIGKSGEVCFRSFRSVSVKYIGQSIEERMLPGGWYRTGDLGTMDAKGRLNVIGRSDDTIKRATVLIYPAAVERVMIQHPKVHLVQVLGVPEARVGQEVCACVVPKEGVDLQESELVDFANEKFLSEGSSDNLSIKPKYFVIMQSLPTTVIGKFNRIKIKEYAIKYLKKE